MDSLKEFQQKIKNRKFAMDHCGKASGDLRERQQNDGQTAQESTDMPLQALPWDQLNENLEEADAYKSFSGYWPLTSNHRLIGKWIVFVKRVIRKLLKIFLGWYIFPHYQRMSHFNGKVVNVISLERDILTAAVQQTQEISQRVHTQEQQISQKFDAQEQQISQKFDAQEQQISQRIDAQERQISQRIDAQKRQISQKFDARDQQITQRIDAQDQKITQKLDAQERQISQKFDAQEQQISQRIDAQERQILHKLDEQKEEAAAGLAGVQKQMEVLLTALQQQKATADDSIQALSSQVEQLISENEQLRERLKKIENLPTDDEEFYHVFEEKFRGPEDLIRDRQRVYVPVIREYISDWTQGRFIDVGSGRGEWLDILRENGAVDYVGVDLNARQNALCEARGHHVVQMDCIAYLADQPDESVDLISGFQIIEHLCMSDLVELLRQSHRVLKPGGIILFETPNPRNLIVGADTFYMDPSHKRPLDPGMVSFIVEWCGYSDVKCMDANSNPHSARTEVPEWNENLDELHFLQEFNDIKWHLYGPQDYAVIGVKEKEQ